MPPQNRSALGQFSHILGGVWVISGAIALPLQAQPSPSEQQLLQAQPRIEQAVATAKACLTVIEAADSRSTEPIPLRAAPHPQAAIARTLANWTIIEVLQQQGNWLQLKAPSGWVPLQATAMHCGRDAADTQDYRTQLQQQANQGQPTAIATLIRLVYRSGTPFPVEWLSQALGNVAVTQPKALVAALEAQTDEVRAPVLLQLKIIGFTPAAQASFAAQLAQQPQSRTAQTWQKLE